MIQELRLSNWMQNKKPEAYKAPLFGRVTQIASGDGGSFTVDYHWPGSWYEPIPLTPEILEKAGFVRQNNGWNIDKKNDFDESHVSLFDNNYCKGKLKLTYNVGNGPTPRVKYLHQLQNLYFALTGQELTIKM